MAYHVGLDHLAYQGAFIYDVLCGGFCFAALLYYIRCRSYARLNLRQSSLFVALYIGALDSKEMAVSLPVIVLAYELLFGVPRPFKLSAIRSGVTANAGLALAATAITAVFIFGKTHGPDAMTRMWAYRPVFTWSRFAESNTRFLNELFHTDRFTIQGVILIWTALLCAALLGRDRRLILLWTWVMVTPLPITFLPHRGGAMLYLVLAGWSMAAAILCEALARLIARTLALHRTPSSVLVTCLLAAAAGLYVKETIRLHEGREAAFLRFGARTWDLIQQFRAFPVHPTHGARILFMNDPFPDLQNPWHTLFVAALSWNDRSLTVWLQSQAHFMESDISRMDYVFRFTAGRLELLSVKAR